MSFPKIEGYVVTEKLGSGSYSTVYKAYTKTGVRTVVAIKCVDKSRVKHSGTAVDNLITEIRLLKTLRHPHIVHMFDFTWDDRNIYIITEYCCGGDLARHVRSAGRLPERQVRYFLQQLVSALKFMWEKGVVHMDLKPHNLLLQKASGGRYTLKVADFGFATYMSAEALRGVRGSPLYMAPEMLRGEGGAPADLWSVGVILYECLFGKAPYSSSTLQELVEKIRNQEPIKIPPHSHISSGCQDLLTRLLQHDPARRISHQELFEHEYLDLDHMPTKENFDKGVGLIRAGVEREKRGEWSGALTAYRDGLRYLVPAVAAEGNTARRAALTHKVSSYMQRAEELQAYLKAQTGVAIQKPPVLSQRAPSPLQKVDEVNGQDDETNIQTDEETLKECEGAEETPDTISSERAGASTGVDAGSGGRGRSWLKRATSRDNSDDDEGGPLDRCRVT